MAVHYLSTQNWATSPAQTSRINFKNYLIFKKIAYSLIKNSN